MFIKDIHHKKGIENHTDKILKRSERPLIMDYVIVVVSTLRTAQPRQLIELVCHIG